MKLPIVRDHMDTSVPTLRSTVPIFDAVDFLLDNRVTGAPVVDAGGRMIGILTETDCLQLLSKGASADVPRGTVADYMTEDVVTIPPDMDVYYAAGIFLGRPFRRLPVVDDGRIVGAITRFDLLRVISAKLR